MLPHLGQTMSEDDLAGEVNSQPTPEFVKLEEQLNRETSVIGMMKEQMKSMIGMVSMFVITIRQTSSSLIRVMESLLSLRKVLVWIS